MSILRIDEILTEKGISNMDFATMLGVSTTSASAFKNGRTKPKFDTLIKMSEVLEVDIRELFKPTKGNAILDGFVEYKNEIHRIHKLEDLTTLVKQIKEFRDFE